VKIIAATKNQGKLREFRRLLASLPVKIESLANYPGVRLPPEAGKTYAENAAMKARSAARALGLPSFGDDSGLEVDCLGGEPGIHSARFASPDGDALQNIVKLLKLMENVPDVRRSARFRTCIVLVFPVGKNESRWNEAAFEGVFHGAIGRHPVGTGGFGYDPVFICPGRGKTVAQLTDKEKDAVSHRGMAARKMAVFIRAHPP